MEVIFYLSERGKGNGCSEILFKAYVLNGAEGTALFCYALRD